MNDQGMLQQAQSAFERSSEVPKWQPAILLVAHDKMVGRQHRSILEKLAIDHRCASNSNEALQIAASEPRIAVVIVDAERADPDGLDLLGCLRDGLAARSWTQFLLVTAKAEANECIKAMRLGAGDILLRPTDMRQFPHAILSLMSRSCRAHEQHAALTIGRAALKQPDCNHNGQIVPRQIDPGTRAFLFGPETPLHTSADQYQSIIDVLLRLREVRQEILPSQASDEVSWTILLDVYQSMRQDQSTSLSNVMISQTSASTALRRVHDMIETGLIDRSPDPDDRRRYFTHLTKKGWDAVEKYLRFAEQMLDAYRHPK